MDLRTRFAPRADSRPSLDAVLDALGTPLAILNEDARIIKANAAWRGAAGRAGQSKLLGTIGDNFLHLCEDAAGEVSGVGALAKGLERVLAGRLSLFERACHMLSRNWRQYLQVRVARVSDADPMRVIVSLKDITDFMEAQRTVRDLDRRILDAETNERRRFAAELHDSVGQSMFSLGLNLSRLRSLVDETEEASRLLSEMKTGLDEVYAQIRTVTYLLQPPWIEEAGGFESMIVQFIQGFARRAGLSAEIRTEGELCTIDSARALVLFRILQEALINVHRHANATKVIAEVCTYADKIILRVQDDGHGICHTGSTVWTPGAGMLGMRARLRQFAGTIKIDGSDAGTILTVSLPMRQESDDQKPRPAALHGHARTRRLAAPPR